MNSKIYCIAILLLVFVTPCMAQVHPHAKAAGSTVAEFSTPAKPDKSAKPVPETPLARSIKRAITKAQLVQPAAKDSCTHKPTPAPKKKITSYKRPASWYRKVGL